MTKVYTWLLLVFTCAFFSSQSLYATAPTTQATTIVFSNVTDITFSLGWTNGNGAGRIVILRAGSAVSFTPVNSTTYTANSNFSSATDLGSGNKCVYNSTGNSVSVTGLSANTVYYAQVFEYNGAAGSEEYNTTTASGNPANKSTLTSEPTTQVTNISFTSATTTSITLNYTNGNGASRIVVAHQGAAVDSDPVDGTSYTANNAFTSGTQIGSGNYVVGSGTGPITVTGLTINTTYYFRVYEFNGSGGTENYDVNTATGNPANQSTWANEPTTQATNIVFSSLGNTGMTLTWTNGDGTERLVLAHAGAVVDSDPVDGTSYTGNSNFGSASSIGTGNKIVYRGSGNSVAVTGLSASTVYYYKVYELNGTGISTNYLTSDGTSGNPLSQTTFANQPTTQATNINFTFVSDDSVTFNFTNGNGSSRIIIVKQGTVDATPTDGLSYTANASFGSGSQLGTGNYVVGIGPGPFTVTNLTGLTSYQFEVFEFNGTAGSGAENYLTTTATNNPKSTTTVCTPPSTQASNVTFTSTIAGATDINWIRGTGDSVLVLVRDGPSATVNPVNNTYYADNPNFGDGTAIVIGGNDYYSVYNGTGTSIQMTGLSGSTSYNVKVYEYNKTGICYLKSPGPATGDVTTLGANNTSTLTGGTGVATISSLVNTSGAAVAAFTFTVNDLGDDGSSTRLQEIKILPDGSNQIDFANAIAGIGLSDNSSDGNVNEYTNSSIKTDSITISGINISSSNGGHLGYIGDGASKIYTLKIYLKSSLGGSLPSTIDNKQFIFSISASDIVTSSGHSGFSPSTSTTSESSGAGKNVVTVVATKIRINTQPSTAATATVPLTTQPIFEATDANNNRDLDFGYAMTVNTSNPTNLGPASAPATFTGGLADFTGSGFNFTNTGSSTMSVTANSITSSNSSSITVSAATTVAQLSSGIATSPLNSSSTNNAILGFSLHTTGSTLTFNSIKITTTSDPNGKVTNVRLYTSLDNDGGMLDNTLVTGTTVTLNTGNITISNINTTVNSSTTNFFVIADVAANVDFNTAAFQPSLAALTDVTMSTGSILGSTFSGTNYLFKDVTPPTATLTSATADNVINIAEKAAGFNVLAHSSEPGYIYVVPQGSYTTNDALYNESITIGWDSVATAGGSPWNATIPIPPASTSIVDNGTYQVYTIDATKNVSSAAAGTFTADLSAPTVTAANISILNNTGPSGTGTTYIPGDQVTASWNNTALGDNNPDVSSVSFDFSQFGGGAVAGSNTAGVWSATYTFVAGSVDAANRNVIVSATDIHVNASSGTTDDSNLKVDVQLPIITTGHITVTSTPSGSSTTYVIGDTLKYQWDASADLNSDIVGVTFDFSQFGGGSAITGVKISSGPDIWQGKYVIAAPGSSIDANNLKASVTATDDASNQKTQQDDANVKMDNVIPALTSANIHITNSGTGTAGIFIIGNTVNAQWNNTGTGDNNPDISSVTFNFTQFDGSSSATGSNSSNTWSGSQAISAGSLEAASRNVSVTITDDAGYQVTATGTDNKQIDDIAPVISSITSDATAQTQGYLIVGNTIVFTLTPNKAEIGGSVTGSYNSIPLTWSDASAGAGTSFTATYTIVNGQTDHKTTPLQISGVTMHDAAGNVSGSASGSDIQRKIDANKPNLVSVADPNNAMIVGHTYTATINITSDTETSPYTLLSGKITPDSLQLANLQRTGNSTYTVQFTINDNGTDVSGASNVPISGIQVRDTAGNTSNVLSGNVIANSNDAIYANLPDITSVVMPKNLGIGPSACVGESITVNGNNFLPNGNTSDTVKIGTLAIKSFTTKTNTQLIFTVPASGTWPTPDVAITATPIVATFPGTRSATSTVNVNPLPLGTPTITTPNGTTYCQGGYINIIANGTLNNSFEFYHWFVGASAYDSTTNTTEQASIGGSYTLKLKNYQTQCETSASPSKSITQIDTPQVNAYVSNPVVCLAATTPQAFLLGSSVTHASTSNNGVWTAGGTGNFFNYTSSTPVAANNYTIPSPYGNTIDVRYTPTLQDVNVGSVKLTLTNSTNPPCAARTDYVIITFASTAIAQITSAPSNTCREDTIVLTGTLNGSSKGGWAWLGPGTTSGTFVKYDNTTVTDSVGIDKSVNPLDLSIKYILSPEDITAGSVSFRLTPDVTSVTCGSTVSYDQATVSIYSKPVTGAIVGNSSVCEGDQGSYYSISGAPSNYTYDWFIPAGTATQTAGGNSSSIAVDWADSSGTVTLKSMAISNTGCRADTAYKPVTVNEKPVITFNTNSGGWKLAYDYAGGSKRLDTLILADNNKVYNNSNYSYQVYGDGITTDTTGQYFFNPVTAGLGTHNITISVKYAFGQACSSDTVVQFQVVSGVYANLNKPYYCTNSSPITNIKVNAPFDVGALDIWIYSPDRGVFIGVHNCYYSYYNDTIGSVNPIQYIGNDLSGNRLYTFDPSKVPSSFNYYYIYAAYEITPGNLAWYDPNTGQSAYIYFQQVDPEVVLPTLPDDNSWLCSTASPIIIKDPTNQGSNYAYVNGNFYYNFQTDSIKGTGMSFSGGWQFDPGQDNLNGADADTLALHYYYTDRGGYGCLSTIDFHIEVRRTPGKPLIASDTIRYCVGQPIADLSATADAGAYVTWYRNGDLSDQPPVIAPTFNTGFSSQFAGTSSQYYLNQNLRQCISQTDSMTIIVNQIPAPLITGLNNYYCDQSPDVVFAVSDTNSTKTPPSVMATDTIKIDGIVQIASTFKTNQYTSGFHAVTYSVENTKNCYAEITDTVEIRALPSITVTGIDAAGYCENYIDSSGTVAVHLSGLPNSNVTSGFPYFKVLTSSNAVPSPYPLDSTGLSMADFRPEGLNPDQYKIIYSYKDGSGCLNRDTSLVQVHPSPVVSFTNVTNNQEFCYNAPDLTLTANPVPDNSSTFGAFVLAGADTLANGLLRPSQLTSGMYSLRYRYKDAYQCPNDTTIQVKVDTIPVVHLAGLSSRYCEDHTDVTFSGTFPSTLTASAEYFEVDGDTLTSSLFSPPAYTRNVAHLVKYIFVDTHQCSNFDTLSVVVKPLPTLSITGIDPVGYCVDYLDSASQVSIPVSGTPPADGSTTLADFHLLSGLNDQTQAYQYSGSSESDIDMFPETLPAGNYTVKYHYTDPFGCSNTTTSPLVINPLTPVSFTNLVSGQKFCYNAPDLTLTGNPVANQSTTFGVFVLNADTLANNIFKPSQIDTGTYNMRYRFVDVNGCLNYTTLQVVRLDTPQVTLVIPNNQTSFCVDAPSVNMSKTPTSTGGTETYFVDNIQVPVGSQFNPANYTANNDHYAKLVYIDASGCVNSDSIQVRVNGLPTVDFHTTNDVYGFCNSQSTPVTFEGLGTSIGGAFTSKSTGGVPQPLANAEFLPSANNYGAYVIDYTYTDVNGCVNDTAKNIQVFQIPQIGVSINSSCITDTIQLSGSAITPGFSNDSISSWKWTFGDGSLSDTNQVAHHKYDLIKTYNVNLSTFTTDGCLAARDTVVNTSAEPKPVFSWMNTCSGISTDFTTQSTVLSVSQIDSVIWSFDGVNQVPMDVAGQSDLSINHTYANGGSYLVSMTMVTTGRCREKITNRVVVSPSLTVTDIPYNENFESASSKWFPDTYTLNSSDSWMREITPGSIIDPDHSHGKIWITAGNASAIQDKSTFYNNERSWVLSPCFDFSAVQKPMISMDIWSDDDNRGDGTVFQVSTDYGNTWENVGNANSGDHWFDIGGISGMSNIGGADFNNPSTEGWSGIYSGWRNAKYALDSLKGKSSVRFRVLFGSNSDNILPANRTTYEGFAFDNVFVGERNRLVLLEQFANRNVSASLNEENFIDGLVSDNPEYVTVKYHTDFPEKDIFNEDNPIDPGARALYYGVSGIPQAVVDGTLSKVDNDSILAQAQKRILQLSPFSISVVSDTSQTGGIRITGTLKALSDVDSSSLNAFAAVIELKADENGKSTENVLRKILPGPQGVAIPGSWKKGDSRSFTLTWGLGNVDSVSNNLRVILFVQNAVTREILQAAFIDPSVLLTKVTGLDNNESPADVRMFPNPASNTVYLQFPGKLKNKCNWFMVNQNGVIYNTGYLNPGQQKYELDVNDAPQGVYIVILNDNKSLNHSGKLIIIH